MSTGRLVQVTRANATRADHAVPASPKVVLATPELFGLSEPYPHAKGFHLRRTRTTEPAANPHH
jgi:hypothetical protein